MRLPERTTVGRAAVKEQRNGTNPSYNSRKVAVRFPLAIESMFELQRSRGNRFVQRLVQSFQKETSRLPRRLPVETASRKEVPSFTRANRNGLGNQAGPRLRVQRYPFGTQGGVMETYVAQAGDSLSLISGYPNTGWQDRLDQLIAANQNHPNIKNRAPDDPRYGWLEIGDIINIPWKTSATPLPSTPLPSTPTSPGAAAPAPPSLDSPANVRVLQAHLNLTVAGISVPVTGTFDALTITALKKWQISKGLQPSGTVDAATVEGLLTEMVAADQHEFAIPLVADAEGLNTSDVVALRTAWTWYPAWGQGDVHVAWEGSLREIWLHRDAFATRARLVAALQQGLAAVPVLAPAGPVPAILAPADEAAAITQVSARLGEPIAISALRDILGASPGVAVDAELVQRLADWQGPGLATGKLDDASLDRIVRTERSGRENSVIRLVMDAFDLGSNALVSVLYEEDFLRDKSMDAVTFEFSGNSGSGARPSVIYLGPRVFGRLAVLLQNIMHELVHVDLSAQGTLQGKRGSPERALHEFLGEATEILAAPRVSVYDTVLMDGTRVLTNWQAMIQSDRAKHWSTFEDVRAAVLQAIATVPAGDQDYAKYQKVQADYCAVLPNNSVGVICSPPVPDPRRKRK